MFSSAEPVALPTRVRNPFLWYVSWVRGNRENAASLERMSRTLALILTDPSNMISMEGCWSLSKMHALAHESILATAGRRVTAAETITLILRAVQEVECLGELVLRKYKGHRFTWNALLVLECVKCLLNVCVHRQLFLMSWMWESVVLQIRRALRRLTASCTGSRKRSSSSSNGVVLSDPGDSASGDGVRLIVPRVVSMRQHEHRLHAKSDILTGEAADVEVEETEAVPFTWVDVLGMLVDVYLLARPVLLVAAARKAFPRDGSANHATTLACLPAAVAGVSNDGAQPSSDALQSQQQQEPTRGDPMAILHAAIAATPRESLFSNWRLWGAFAAVDAVVALLSRFIRHYRVPVVYIGEEKDEEQQRLQLNYSRGNLEASSSLGNAEEMTTTRLATAEAGGISSVPAVVSRDSLRIQQAIRGIMYSFLRDPFFSNVLKQFIYRHFVKGFVNRIPLIGSLIGFQVSYFLSMQHYSFLYSIGQ